MGALPEPLAPHAHRRAVLAGIAGNVLEWYDFAVYGYFAPAIGQHFFPARDRSTSLIAAFGVFAAGFLMRPLGGLVFGHIGDRHGRGTALILSVLAMAFPTFLIGVLPGHETLGLAAPILLVGLRMIQGLSVGGEFTTSIVFLVEAAPPHGRGLAGSWSAFGATAGVLLGSAAGALTSAVLPSDAIEAWGWRLPFLAGLVVGLAGLVLRRHLPETGGQRGGEGRAPLVEAFRTEWRAMLRLASLVAFLAVGFYLIFVFAVTWLQDSVHFPEVDAFDINTISMVVLLATILASGALSDRIGRKPLLLASTGGGLLLAWPLFWLMDHEVFAVALAGQIGFALLVGTFSGAFPAAMVEALPAHIRCTGVSVSYNICLGLVGGTTPMVAQWLIARTHADLAPAFYLMAAAAVSFAAALGIRKRDFVRE
jgi:MHS family proline/betaine transporter-like MFS transporter